MGHLTTLTILNDALGALESDPKQFGERVFDAINRANMHHLAVDASFVEPNGSLYCGYIHVQPSRHADSFTIYVHSGNTVQCVGLYEPDFEKLMERSPEYAAELVRKADEHIKTLKMHLKKKAKK